MPTSCIGLHSPTVRPKTTTSRWRGFFWSNRFSTTTPTGGKLLIAVELDPEQSLPDVNRKNNAWHK